MMNNGESRMKLDSKTNLFLKSLAKDLKSSMSNKLNSPFISKPFRIKSKYGNSNLEY